MSGLPFWDVAVELPNEAPIEDTNENTVPTNVSKVPYSQQQEEIEFRNRLAEQVVQKMTEEKK